jgi:RNase P subunit RPR2
LPLPEPITVLYILIIILVILVIAFAWAGHRAIKDADAILARMKNESKPPPGMVRCPKCGELNPVPKAEEDTAGKPMEFRCAKCGITQRFRNMGDLLEILS